MEHILQCGLPSVDERHRTLCQDVPVLAVFLCYLQATGRQPWLEELLVEQDFGNWVANRVKRTLGREGIDQDLALLIAQFPLPQRTMTQLYADFGELIERLSADGWIVRSTSCDVDQWATIHDVLADRIVLSYLQRIGDSVQLFVERALDFAEQHDSLRSAFTIFQRLADQPVVSRLPWKGILEQRLLSRPAARQPDSRPPTGCESGTRTRPRSVRGPVVNCS